MKLYNTLTRKNEKVEALPEKQADSTSGTTNKFSEPAATNKLGLYACGFTVYDYTHLGHLRKYSLDDVLVRTLRHAGFEVNHVQNITDVGHLASDADTGEDKLEKGAKKYQMTVWEIAKKFEDYFFDSMDQMGNLRPDVSCRATEHIKEQLALVVELEKKGFTYVIKGDGVYFDTSKLSDYGQLARLKLDQQQAGARVAKVAGKKNPTDFALWKFERPGENRAMVWESPWHQRSFPGWHVECSAMSAKYLGEQFEIHTGGIDHIPVHHVNEIAQSEAASGKKPFVKYWVHHNFLRVAGEKMSKSLGNFYTIDDILKKDFEPMALRLLFLMTHYRSEMNFTWESLAAAQKSWERLKKIVRDIKKRTPDDYQPLANPPQAELESPAASTGRDFSKKFFDLMEDDLRTPEALAVIWEMLKSDLIEEEKYQLLLEFDEVLGLGVSKIRAKSQRKQEEIPEEIQKLVQERQEARKKKDWQKADQLRKKIEKAGWLLTDQDSNTSLRKI